MFKHNKCFRLPDSGGGSWILIPGLSSCPSIPLWLASYLLAPAGGRTQSLDCALRIPVSNDRRRACLFSFLYIKLFELGVEVSFNHRSRLPTTKSICSNSHSGAAALSAPMMRLCCSDDDLLLLLSPLGTPRPYL